MLCTTTAAIATSATGCGSSSVTEPIAASIDNAAGELQAVVNDAATEDLKRYKVALRGYQIVSPYIAGRVVLLPYPGMRVLAVFIVATSVSAKLAIEYIDDELIHRKFEESLTDRERSEVERDGYIEIETDSGVTEKVYLAATKYVNDA